MSFFHSLAFKRLLLGCSAASFADNIGRRVTWLAGAAIQISGAPHRLLEKRNIPSFKEIFLQSSRSSQFGMHGQTGRSQLSRFNLIGFFKTESAENGACKVVLIAQS